MGDPATVHALEGEEPVLARSAGYQVIEGDLYFSGATTSVATNFSWPQVPAVSALCNMKLRMISRATSEVCRHMFLGLALCLCRAVSRHVTDSQHVVGPSCARGHECCARRKVM